MYLLFQVIISIFPKVIIFQEEVSDFVDLIAFIINITFGLKKTSVWEKDDYQIVLPRTDIWRGPLQVGMIDSWELPMERLLFKSYTVFNFLR